MDSLELISPFLDTIDSIDKEIDQEMFEQYVLKLEPLVSKALQSDMQLLLNTLYRLDVYEEKVKYILFGNHEEKASLLLSRAILEREIVRKIFRLKYGK
jgi:hypothetical protein